MSAYITSIGDSFQAYPHIDFLNQYFDGWGAGDAILCRYQGGGGRLTVCAGRIALFCLYIHGAYGIPCYVVVENITRIHTEEAIGTVKKIMIYLRHFLANISSMTRFVVKIINTRFQSEVSSSVLSHSSIGMMSSSSPGRLGNLDRVPGCEYISCFVYINSRP